MKNGLGMRAFGFSNFPIIVLDNANFNFTCSPNPSGEVVRVTWDNQANGFLEVFDMLGKSVYRQRIEKAFQTTLNVSQWTSANYFVQFKSDTGKIYSKRLAVLH
jgi:hypothetical protein